MLLPYTKDLTSSISSTNSYNMTYQPNCKRMLAAVIMMLLMLPLAVIAQFKVTGTVVDKKNNTPVPGVVVREKGTKQGTTTDAKGAFSLDVKSGNAALLVSFMGYLAREIPLNGAGTVSISLEEDIKALGDVVVIGYQDITRRKTTGAVASVKGKEIENTPYPSFEAMLQGRVAGLSVLSISGEPGSNNIVNVRGSSSVVENGISQPLYVIDGIVYDVNDMGSTYGNSSPLAGINPNDIESIDVLKDASASAIYGARAANGVIIVKTKRPKSAKPEYRVSVYGGMSSRPALKPIIVGAAERRYKMDLMKDLGSPDELLDLNMMLTDSLNTAFNNATDWQGLFIRNASVSNADVSIGAATESFSYRLSVNRYAEQGVMIGYDFQRTTPRLFLSLKPSKNVEITSDVFMGFIKSTHGQGEGVRYPFTAWGFPSSFWQITETDRKAYTGRYDDLMDDDRGFSVTGNTRLLLTIKPGLIWNTNVAYNFINNRRDYLLPAAINYGSNRAQSTVNQVRRYEVENYLMYNKTLHSDHTLTALVGQGVEQQTNNGTYLYGNNIAINGVKTVQGVAPGPNLSGSSFIEERARLSFFGRLGYDYKGKYLIQANYRRDGSSRFSKDDRWGEFPSVSAGWVVSDESIWYPLRNIVSFFKVRGSYGITGLDPGGYYAQYLRLITDASYPGSTLTGVGGSGDLMSSYNGTTVVYPNYYGTSAATGISWERSPQGNIGVDMNMLKDRIQLSVDYYRRDSKSKVFDVPVATTTGYTSVSDNYVDVRNQGIEFAINTINMSPKSKFQWRTNFNLAYNKNLITKLPQGGRDFKFGPPWLQRTLTVGQPLFGYMVWDVEGIYARDEDVPVDPLTGQRITWYGTPFKAGDPARKDQNGDYQINDLDKVAMGDPNPKFVGGFTNSFAWKGFSLDVLFTFFAGRKLWNGYLSDKMQDAGTSDPYSLWGPRSGPASDFGTGVGFWRNPGDDAKYPALVTNTVDKWHIAQSLFVEDASFFRMKNLRLGYSLPEKIVSKAKMKYVRFYGVMDNIFVLSNATVPDPEAVEPNGYSSGNDYPIPKKFTLGLEVNF